MECLCAESSSINWIWPDCFPCLVANDLNLFPVFIAILYHILPNFSEESPRFCDNSLNLPLARQEQHTYFIIICVHSKLDPHAHPPLCVCLHRRTPGHLTQIPLSALKQCKKRILLFLRTQWPFRLVSHITRIPPSLGIPAQVHRPSTLPPLQLAPQLIDLIVRQRRLFPPEEGGAVSPAVFALLGLLSSVCSQGFESAAPGGQCAAALGAEEGPAGEASGAPCLSHAHGGGDRLGRHGEATAVEARGETLLIFKANKIWRKFWQGLRGSTAATTPETWPHSQFVLSTRVNNRHAGKASSLAIHRCLIWTDKLYAPGVKAGQGASC